MNKYATLLVFFTFFVLKPFEETAFDVNRKFARQRQQILQEKHEKSQEVQRNIRFIKDTLKRGQTVNLPGAYLVGANLSYLNLNGANLAGANLYKARLTGSSLQDANLEKADLQKATAAGVNFSGANLACANFRNAQFYIQRRWPWQTQDRTNFSHVFAVGTNFEYTDMHNALFNAANLSNAKFARAKLQGAEIDNVKAKGTDFSHIRINARTSFKGTDVRQLDTLSWKRE